MSLGRPVPEVQSAVILARLPACEQLPNAPAARLQTHRLAGATRSRGFGIQHFRHACIGFGAGLIQYSLV